MSGQAYTILRVFSNNVILVREAGSGEEVILLGKGIGFGRKSGDPMAADDARIEKRFRLESESHIKQYHRLINEVDRAIIGLSEEIIAMIARGITPEINEHVHVALPDHIQFALDRLRNGLEIVNPFLWEIRSMYPKEFALAQKAAEMIQERDDIDYLRLVTHLRFAVERIRRGRCIQNPLLDGVKASCPEAYRLAEGLCRVIAERLEVSVPEDEAGYIAMHVQRLLALAGGHEAPQPLK